MRSSREAFNMEFPHENQFLTALLQQDATLSGVIAAVYRGNIQHNKKDSDKFAELVLRSKQQKTIGSFALSLMSYLQRFRSEKSKEYEYLPIMCKDFTIKVMLMTFITNEDIKGLPINISKTGHLGDSGGGGKATCGEETTKSDRQLAF